MPALRNPKHERFAQLRFTGETIDDAYSGAGYKPNRGNAATLNANQSVRDRIAEMQEAAARQAIQAIAYDAKSLFARLESQITRALEAGDHKVAMDGRQFMIRCFGYEDSPTLTHDHIAGRQLAPQHVPAAPSDNIIDITPQRRFGAALVMIRKKLAE